MVITPFISPDSVRVALDSLLYSSSKKDVQLLFLSAVEEFLTDPSLPPSSYNRELALSHILTSLIRDQFLHQRTISGYQLPEPNQSKESIFEMIRRDGAAMSAEKIGWSWLYHHYVRVDLDIQIQDFCHILHIEDRTLRRYQQYIIKRLTALLIDAEWYARKQQHKRRLLTELPRSANFEFLPVREKLTAYVNQMFTAARPAHFFISGSRGIGKTTFIERILQRQIDDGSFDQLIWISKPISTNYIENYLIERLIPSESHIELREYLLLHHTVIVLDDIELLFNDVSRLHLLIQMLTASVVFMTSSGTYTTLPDTIQITLQEFNDHDVQSYISHVLESTQHSESVDNNMIKNIRDYGGGNPFALQLIIRNLPYFDLRKTDKLIGLNAFYERIFQLLNIEGQLAWIILAIQPQTQIDFKIGLQMWSKHITRDSMEDLLKYQIIEEMDSRHFHLTNGAQRYIEDEYGHENEQIRKVVDNLLQGFDAHVSSDGEPKEICLLQVENLLLIDWIDVRSVMRNKWIAMWHNEGVRQKHWAKWRTILEKQLDNGFDVNLYKSYATCLRNLGEWKLARQVLEIILSETGRAGVFSEQAEALLHLSVLLRYQGNYEGVFEILSRAERIAFSYNLHILIGALAVEKVHLAIDISDVQVAQDFIAYLPDDVQSTFLKSEISFLEGDYKHSKEYAQLALKDVKDFLLRARIYALLGRICEQENNLEGAEENFSWSLMILEQNGDLFSLSRAQLNLGGLFIRGGNYEEALALLHAAEQIQRQIGNQVTLAAIKHNLRLIDIALSSSDSLQ